MREKADISEVFMSYQGEGLYVGIRQVFVRFYGCSFGCAYCDTNPGRYESLTQEELLGRILNYNRYYHSVSLTGGEPLEQSDFLMNFLPLLKKTLVHLLEGPRLIYLETNGILYDRLKNIVSDVDIISMDIKLPTSTDRRAVWHQHRKFLEIASSKNVFVKAVLTDKTAFGDIITAGNMIKGINAKIPFILQPIDSTSGANGPRGETTDLFKYELEKMLKDVRIVPQCHKSAGIR